MSRSDSLVQQTQEGELVAHTVMLKEEAAFGEWTQKMRSSRRHVVGCQSGVLTVRLVKVSSAARTSAS